MTKNNKLKMFSNIVFEFFVAFIIHVVRSSVQIEENWQNPQLSTRVFGIYLCIKSEY